ncbi:MAG TPA: LCP family protein [Patescibacteria group bacterium]|nr:LCP family protein [Patescibacteria group bacterium]
MDGADKRNQGSIDGFISRPIQTVPRPIERPKIPQPNQSSQPYNYQSYYRPSDLSEAVSLKPVPKKKRSARRKIAYSVLTLLLIGFGIGAWYGSAIIGSLNKVFHGNVFSDVRALISTTKLKGEDQGRVNILLAGDSADDPGHAGANLTDSIMVVSIDTKKHTGIMLSIPRDLWVSIPNWSHQKINAANEATNFQQNGYPSGGMGQLEQIVHTDLGIPINYYALINYSAFKSAVDSVGGITVNIQSPDPRGLYDSFASLKLPNGLDILNGQQALDLARARGDNSAGDRSYGFDNSDFARTQHQRQMLLALSEKTKSIGVITNPIKVTNLFKSFSTNIKTDFNLQEILRFSQITKGINLNKLQSISYSYGGKDGLIKDFRTPDGQSALVPAQGVDDFGQLKQYYQQLSSNNPVVREAPSVVVLNGSGVNGLAHKVSTILSSDGYNVKGVADANGLYSTSIITDLSNGLKPSSIGLLKTILPKGTSIAPSTSTIVEAHESIGYNADFVVILGQNSGKIQTP